jgi:putative oxidoreductase
MPNNIQIITNTTVLRFAISIILLSHSIPSLFNGDVQLFGKLFLDNAGFAPFGILLAWLLKLSHIISAGLLMFNLYTRIVSIFNILFLMLGIILVHSKNGWFVVGSGSNGMEYNFILICILVSILAQEKHQLITY